MSGRKGRAGRLNRTLPDRIAWQPSPAAAVGLLFLAALLAYGNSLGGRMVMDDTVIVLGNPAIQGLGHENLSAIFGGHYWQAVESRGGLYRPVVMLSYAVNYALGGERPEGYHAVNILLHAANGVLVFFLLEALFRRRMLSFIAALFFALHPIRTEGVASIVGRAESLAALFVLGSWLSYVRARLGSAPLSLAGAAILYGLACLTKESAFSFAGLLPVTDFVLARGGKGTSVRAALLRYAPFAAAAVVVLAFRYQVLGGFTPLFISPASNPLVQAGPWVRFLSATHVFARYVWLLVFPVNLSADYSFNQIPLVASVLSLRGGVPLVLLAAFLAGVSVSARRSPALFLAGAAFLIPFILTSNWFRPIGTIMAERLMYLPGLGFNLAAAVAACAGMESARFRKAAAWLTVALAAGYAARTWDRNFDWRDHYALFHSALRTSPDSALVQANYAAILLHERNDPAAAIPHARRALEIQPADPPALFTLGEASLRTGDLARAAEALEKVVSLAPRTSGGVDALRRLGPAYERMGRREDAASAYRRLLEWRPGDARAKEALGRLAAYAGPAR